MGWERRGNRHYFYRKRRVGKRVVSEYIGAGEAAEAIAAAVEAARASRQLRREERRAERDSLSALLDVDADVQGVISSLTHAWRVAAGCHRHRGEWRRRRST